MIPATTATNPATLQTMTQMCLSGMPIDCAAWWSSATARSARPVAVGEYVSSASIVATILRSNPIKIQIQISEADIPSIALGRGVSIEVDAYKDRRFAGTVTAVNPAVFCT